MCMCVCMYVCVCPEILEQNRNRHRKRYGKAVKVDVFWHLKELSNKAGQKFHRLLGFGSLI